jgi:polysaccharide export outer membrane protein
MLLALTSLRSSAQTAQPSATAKPVPTAKPAPAAPVAPVSVPLPADFVIGPEDGLGVLFWHEPEMSGDVVVRPDGLITLPLIGDIRAAGLKPEALREEIQKAASRYLTEANVMVVVRQINSRRVFITGEVAKPGAYPLTGPRTVMQLIALAGGLNEYADAKSITVMRIENGRQRIFQFHYKDVARGKALAQNITLQPGDTVVVP